MECSGGSGLDNTLGCYSDAGFLACHQLRGRQALTSHLALPFPSMFDGLSSSETQDVWLLEHRSQKQWGLPIS